jgi:hypothetical protein
MDQDINGGAPIQFTGPSHGTPLSARKNQTTTRPFRLIFEVGAGRSFLEIRGGEGGSFAERPTPLPASVVDPDGSEGFGLETKLTRY